MALNDVVAVVADGFAAFELGVVCEVFGYDRSEQGLPRYDFAVVAAEEPPLLSGQGFRLDTDHRLDRVATADLVCVPAWRDPLKRPPEEMLEAIVGAVDRGARVLSVCTGAFVLAEAGLLDGRRATTHWRHAELLAERYPAIDVTPDVLYVEDGPVITSAGTAAGILPVDLRRRFVGWSSSAAVRFSTQFVPTRTAIAVTAVVAMGVLVGGADNSSCSTGALVLPAGFQVGLEASGFVKPTAFAFAPDGRWFVAGKDGRVWVVNPPGVINADGTTQKVLLDIRNKVNANSDRGLNGIALDKDFVTNGLLYLLYVYELQPSTPDQGGPMVSRLTRVTVTPSNTVSPETVVLGTYSAGPCPTADNAVDCIHAGIEVPRANATGAR